MKRALTFGTLVCLLAATAPVFAQSNVFPATGNVGINIPSPDQKLVVSSGNIKVFNAGPYPYGIVIDQNFSGNWAREFGLSYNGKGKMAAFGVYAADSIFKYAYIGGNTTANSPYGQPWMVFDTASNVGVGFTVPKDLLHARRDVLGTTFIHVQNNYENTAMTARAGYAISTQNGTWRLTAARGGGFSITSPEAADIFWVTNQGNFGMGTKTPGTHKLAVEGTIGARKVKVTQTAWADFVFDPEYKLMPLADLEQFIRRNRHLPEIPSAATVAQDGLDLGEINRRLLQKVEEQALYIIEMNKKLEALSEKIDNLEKR